MKENEYFLYFIIFSLFLFLVNIFAKKPKKKNTLYEKKEKKPPPPFTPPKLVKVKKVDIPIKKDSPIIQEEILSSKNLQRAVIVSEILKRPYLD